MNPTDVSGEPTLDADTVYFNGVSALTGKYLVPPTPLTTLATLIKGQSVDSQTRTLSRIWKMFSGADFGLPVKRDPTNLRESGWGIVFHTEESREVRDALKPLIEHRRNQVGDESLVKVLDYKMGEGRAQWLARFRVSAGAVNPCRVPYYLLLVGSPAQIPFTFGFLLDVEYAVGRMAFDTPQEYATYAQNMGARHQNAAFLGGPIFGLVLTA